MFSKYMTIKGHSCNVSNDGRNGLGMVQAGNYDVVLLDLAMPEFSGVDVVDALERANLMQKINIVALTASSISSEKDEYLKKKGVHAVLRKPIDPDELLDYLQQFDGKAKSG